MLIHTVHVSISIILYIKSYFNILFYEGVYPMLSPQALTVQASNRVCNALALLQCVASHPETKSKLIAAHIPLYLYPFLNTISKHKPFEYLRLTSLGVIGALVKADDPEVVNFLLQTEMIPLCLRIMETVLFSYFFH